MTIHAPSLAMKPPIDHARFCRNGQLVQAPLYSRVARDVNHVAGYRRKRIASFSQKLDSIASGASGTTSCWRSYFHTGHNVKYIEAEIIAARPDGGTAPYSYISIAEAPLYLAGDTSDYWFHGNIDSSPSDTPDEWSSAVLRCDASSDQAYALQVVAVDYARPISVVVYEVGETPCDTSNTGCVNPNYGVGDPILDAHILELCQAQDELLRTNRAHLFSWSPYGSYSRVTGTTYTSVVDGSSTTTGAAVPAPVLENQYHNTKSRTAVPGILAVYANPDTNDAFVKIDDGTNTIEVTITGGGSTTWYTQAGSIPAAAATKYVPMAKAGGAAEDIDVYAVAFFEFE